MLSAGIVDPVSDEGTDRVEELPEGHDLATDLRRRNFSNVNGSRSESNALTNTDQDSAKDKDTELVVRCEGLDDGSDNGDEASDAHSCSTSEPIGKRTSKKPTRHNCSDRV